MVKADPYYQLYKNVRLWRVIDFVVDHLYIVIGIIVIFFCTNWQISLSMAFYLICIAVLCVRASSALYNMGFMQDEKRKELSVDDAH